MIYFVSLPKLNKYCMKKERFSLREMEHMAVNFAIVREKGFKGTFLDYYALISPTWRKWLKKMDKEHNTKDINVN